MWNHVRFHGIVYVFFFIIHFLCCLFVFLLQSEKCRKKARYTEYLNCITGTKHYYYETVLLTNEWDFWSVVAIYFFAQNVFFSLVSTEICCFFPNNPKRNKWNQIFLFFKNVKRKYQQNHSFWLNFVLKLV